MPTPYALTVDREVTLKPSQVEEAFTLSILSRRPCIAWSAPGVGKSALARQACQKVAQHTGMEYRFIDIRAAMWDAVDVHGLPAVVTDEDGEKIVKWIVSSVFPKSGRGVILLDELNRAPVMVMNALLQLVLDRCIGDYQLPDGWSIIAACNRETDGGGVQRMPAALSLRFWHVNLVSDLQEFSLWALDHGIHPMVLAYLRFDSDALHQFDPKLRVSPNPRSWTMLSELLVTSESLHLATSDETRRAMIVGTIGNEVGIKFLAFMHLFSKLPNIDQIIQDPTGAPVPTDAGVRYAVSATLGARADASNFDRIIQYLGRLPQEYMVFCVRDATRRTPALTLEPVYTRWIVRNQDIMK